MMKAPGKVGRVGNLFSLIKYIYKNPNILLKGIHCQHFYLLGKEKKPKDKMTKEIVYMFICV